MEVNQIITKRLWEHNYAYDIIYEWEDVFSGKMSIPLYNEKAFINNRYFKCVPYIPSLLQTNEISLEFEMSCFSSHWYTDRKSNIIPMIIDFYPYEKGFYGMKMFNHLYKCHPVVLVSSAEVYDYLRKWQGDMKVKVEHVPLSLPDKYRLTSNVLSEKEYDLVLVGRQSPVLMSYLKQYKESHPDFEYIYNIRKGNQLLYYSSKGDLVGDVNTRDKYMAMVRKAKCAFYTTPGIDNEKQTHGFNQITPRFLELLSCGCHVIARFVDNADSEYYEVKRFCKCINTYKDFQNALDFGRFNDVDINIYSNYLEKHYTSVRVESVKDILKVL